MSGREKGYGGLFSLKGMTAAVTGGEGLLGSRIGDALRAFGCRVFSCDIHPARRGPAFIQMDISSERSVDDGLAKIVRKTGRLDILVNSAYPRTPDWGAKLEKVTFASWKQNLDSHLGGYFLVSRSAAELMKKRKQGSIINFCSIYGICAPDFSIYEGTKMTMPAAYAAIKSGVLGMTRYIAAYYAPWNIRANVISPGGVFDGQKPSFVARYRQKTPLGRMAEPRDICGGVVYLASGASAYVTGINLVIDGGWTMR